MQAEISRIPSDLKSAASRAEFVRQWLEQTAPDTTHPRIYPEFVRVLLDEGSPTRAFELARIGTAAHPYDSWIRYYAALALSRGGNYVGAENYLNPIAQSASVDGRLRAKILGLLGRLAKSKFERDKSGERGSHLAEESMRLYAEAAGIPPGSWYASINATAMARMCGRLGLSRGKRSHSRPLVGPL